LLQCLGLVQNSKFVWQTLSGRPTRREASLITSELSTLLDFRLRGRTPAGRLNRCSVVWTEKGKDESRPKIVCFLAAIHSEKTMAGLKKHSLQREKVTSPRAPPLPPPPSAPGGSARKQFLSIEFFLLRERKGGWPMIGWTDYN
jgi:hypothetical protein